MVTSSAEPERLEAYPGRLTQADADLTTLAADLDEKMSAFAAGGSIYVPQGFDAAWGGKLVRGLRDESGYLAGWVASVGWAFREADRLGIPPDQIDAFISERVGEPTLAEAEAEARGLADANELRRQLEALGIDPDHFDPSQLHNLELDPEDPRYRQLFDLMVRIGENMWNEDYASRFYDQMDADGIRATLGVIETFAAHQVWRPTDDHGRPRGSLDDLGNIRELLLDPFVMGFALASGSVDLSEERDALLHPGDDVNGDARWKQHQLSLLLSGEGRNYDPAFLAAAADVILVSNSGVNWIDSNYGTMGSPYDTDYPPLYIGPDLWGGDLELGVPQALALRALADNNEASWQFSQMGYDNLEAILRPDTSPIDQLVGGISYTGYEYDDVDHLKGLMEQYGADVTRNTFVEVPMEHPERYPQALDAYADVVRIVGDGDIPDVTKRTVANSLAVYIDDIGDAALIQSESTFPDDDARGAQDFNRPDLVDFFQELGYDEAAAREVGTSVTLWAETRSAGFINDTDLQQGEINEAFRPVTLVMGSVQDGFDAIGSDSERAYRNLATGVSTAGGIIAAAGGIAAFAAVATPAAPFISLGGAVTWMTMSGTALAIPGMASDAPIPGNDMENIILGQLRQDMALAVAADQGLPTPTAGSYATTLDHAFPGTGDPFSYVDLTATDEQHDYEEDDHWSRR